MNNGLWKHFPWLVGLLAAPLLLGCATAEGQSLVGLLFGTSLLLLAPDRAPVRPALPSWLRWTCVALLVLPLIPLPVEIIRLLSPERLALAARFPVDASETPRWLTLSLSPSGTVSRLWEIVLALAAFALARAAAERARLGRAFVLVTTLALLALAASDVAFRADGRRALLGLWPDWWSYGAGTFANRNHFAGWIVVAALFAVGWALRNAWPMQSPRLHTLPPERRSRVDALLVALTPPFALAMAFWSGSRGALVALAAGVVVWLAAFGLRSRRRTRLLAAGAVLLALIALIAGTSDLIFRRASTGGKDIAYKAGIWVETARMAAKFPLTGTGWGTFQPVFAHHQTIEAEKQFYHAENDLVQLAAEVGIPAALLFALALALLLHAPLRAALKGRVAEPELLFGALAALAAFFVHSCFEFVAQIPACLIFAAALLGHAVGQCEQATRPEVLPPPARRRIALNLAAALIVLTLAAAQGFSWLQWRDALAEKSPAQAAARVGNARQFWPWNPARETALARLRFEQIGLLPATARPAAIAAARAELTLALALAPLDVDLRFLRAWQGLALSTNRPLAVAQAWETLRLAPRRADLALAFARQAAVRDARLALEFLRAAPLENPRHLRVALELAWSFDPSPAALWPITPNTATGLLELGDFALRHRLDRLAVQAFLQLTNALPADILAAKLLAAHDPAGALKILPTQPATADGRRLAARASLELGLHRDALRHAEAAWRDTLAAPLLLTPAKSSSDLTALRELLRTQPRNETAAVEFAEKTLALAPAARDAAFLRELAALHPRQLRLQWIHLQTLLEIEDEPAAARAAVNLAEHAHARTQERLRPRAKDGGR